MQKSTEEMKDMKPHNPPNRCKKCKEFFRIPMHAPVNTKRCECKLLQVPAKNIFEAIITKMKRNGQSGVEIAEVCNTLHQQAIKNILDRLCHSPKDIPTILKEIAKENDIEL